MKKVEKVKEEKIPRKTYTITYGDVAENHARMQKIGELASHGYSVDQLLRVQQRLTEDGFTCEFVDLSPHWSGEGAICQAGVLVIRGAVQRILGALDTKELMAEHDRLEQDKMALMRNRVVNKLARWNLCFADFDQEPDYANGKGRVVGYHHVPMTEQIRWVISEWMEEEALNAEANYYYDIEKCGIGYHGDSERRKVVAMRMGESMPLYYQWFQNSEPVGERVQIDLSDGDMYIMSEKAVGTDWKKKIIGTLRHATGCDKFTVMKKE